MLFNKPYRYKYKVVYYSKLFEKGYYDALPRNSIGNIIIPGNLNDRERHWGIELDITAITDTIAWTSLTRPIFKRLFRQDLMVAALFRNFY